MSASTPYILCDNLVKIYKIAELEVVALQGLDLAVHPKEMLGVVGASGSGKSSLLNILGGLDRPSAGKVWVEGKNLLKMNAHQLDEYRRSTVGFVWQQGARNLVPYLDIEENVLLPMTLTGKSGTQAVKQARSLLERVGLDHRRGHQLSELSGGEQQRVAIAVALANQPRLLLADEPTGELDSKTALSIYRLLRELNQTLALTVIIVSHDHTLAHHVDRVVAIRDGKLATETIRQAVSEAQGKDDAEEKKEIFEEFTVLDSAGRLQIPKDLLQKMQIRGRVRLEVVKEGILVRPAKEAEPAHTTEELSSHITSSRRQPRLITALNQLAKVLNKKNPPAREK
ncbi:MAG TPA: ATP-binding cassette domain-containing protein [Anaerolineaceae bacterium]